MRMYMRTNVQFFIHMDESGVRGPAKVESRGGAIVKVASRAAI